MALPAPKSAARVSIAEYLRREETSDVRHEYHDGEVLEMSGGTINHGRMTRNLLIAAGTRVRPPCEAFDSNMRVAVSADNRFVYPDVSVICGPPEFHPEDPNRTTIINPRVIFEVLSPSTERYDRGEKFQRYNNIDSLEEYVLLTQTRPVVEGFLRQGDGTWSLQRWQGQDVVARVRCLGLDLPLAELYLGVDDIELTPPDGLLKVEVQP